MAKVLEAALVLKAEDRTGQTFLNVSKKLDQVSHAAKGMERVSLQASRMSAGGMERVSLQASRMSASVGGVAPAADRAALAMGGMLRSALALGAAYATLDRAQVAYKRHAEVDRSMTRTGLTGDAGIKETADGLIALRNIARDTSMPFDNVQKAMDSVVATGRGFGDALKMMPAITKTAQASGAEAEEIARSSTALIDHFKIKIEELQRAQDTLAKGGQLGQFELKDMARYLPSMLPAVKAIGLEGQAGLEKLVAILQVIRKGTGTAEEAASSANNIFSKMESEETVNNFKKMGVDLRKEMAAARKDGKELLSTFVELSQKALKGDMSKLPQLFGDMEFARGMRALIVDWERVKELQDQIRAGAAGTVDKNLARVINDAKSGTDRLAESYDRASAAAGKLASVALDGPIKSAATNLDGLAQKLETYAAKAKDLGVWQATKDHVIKPIIDEAPSSAERRSVAEEAERYVARDRAQAEMRNVRNETAGIRSELDVRKGQLERAPGNKALQRRIADLESRLARSTDAVRDRERVRRSMPELPPALEGPDLRGLGWKYPDREGYPRHPDTPRPAPQGARPVDVPAPPVRPPEFPTGPTIKPALLDPEVTTNRGAQQVQVQGDVKGEVKGETQVSVNVKVDASPQLQATVASIEAGLAQLRGIIAGGIGSTGTATGEATP